MKWFLAGRQARQEEEEKEEEEEEEEEVDEEEEEASKAMGFHGNLPWTLTSTRK